MNKKLLSEIKQSNGVIKSVRLDGECTLSIPEIVAVGKDRAKVEVTPTPLVNKRLKTIHKKMMEQVMRGIPIYGTTTAYGGQASLVLTKGAKKKRLNQATKLSEAILHIDVSTGPSIPLHITRSAILLRLNMLLPGYSAVRLSTLHKLKKLLNSNITPIVGQYGTVGASGDLAQNGRIVATLLHTKHTKVWDQSGKNQNAKTALSQAGIPPLQLKPKEGLGLANGDNFSTSAASHIADEIARLLLITLSTSSLAIQALRGTDRNYHPLLHTVRPHPGQIFTAKILRSLLNGSKLAYQEMKTPLEREEGIIIQDVYSLRCLPQYYGPSWETLASIWKTIEINANSVSDNPLWTTPETATEGEAPYQWVSGGNFLAMHMGDALDKLRKIAIHIVKQNDRHLARMIHPKLNNGLPANLSHPDSISQCTFKGLQTQMGMYDVYSSILGAPVTTAFGVHEELNQDVTSHAFTSAIMTNKVLKIARYAIATNLMATCQAIDLRGGKKLISPSTVPVYEWVRKTAPLIKKDQPLGHYVEQLSSKLDDRKLNKHIIQVANETL